MSAGLATFERRVLAALLTVAVGRVGPVTQEVPYKTIAERLADSVPRRRDPRSFGAEERHVQRVSALVAKASERLAQVGLVRLSPRAGGGPHG